MKRKEVIVHLSGEGVYLGYSDHDFGLRGNKLVKDKHAQELATIYSFAR